MQLEESEGQRLADRGEKDSRGDDRGPPSRDLPRKIYLVANISYNVREGRIASWRAGLESGMRVKTTKKRCQGPRLAVLVVAVCHLNGWALNRVAA
jgi:hypothetical protein